MKESEKKELIGKIEDYVQNTENDIDSIGEELKLEGISVTVEEVVGGEGEGDYCHYVFKVSDSVEEFFLKLEGFHSSYEGMDFTDSNLCEVRPYEKKVRDWEKVK